VENLTGERMSNSNHISYSELSTLNRCKRLWAYGYEWGWKPKREGAALSRGRWMHELLAAFYRGDDWIAKHEELIDQADLANLFEEEIELFHANSDLFKQVMTRYALQGRALVTYFDEKGAFVERELDIPLPSGGVLRVKIDLVATDGDTLWVVDHKSTEDFDKNMESMTDIDPQLSFYVWGLRALGLPVAGAIHNYIRMRLPAVPDINKDGSMSKRFIITDEPTVREFVARSGAKISPEDLETYIAKLPQDAFFRQFTTVRSDEELTATVSEIEAKVQERELVREKGLITRTLIKDCQRCPFYKPCIAALKGGDEELILMEGFTRKEEREEHEAMPVDYEREEVAA